ncbi:MAG: MerR family transcriptional regulator [Actinobacteria bacterium]|nr:MAG: MerR family transcriptional regulator [Actinomycetota bacterium]
MRIGELSSRTGASARSLRYYEQHGLLPTVRQPNGYRGYPESAVQRVRNIQAMLSVGFSVEEIRAFTDCLDDDMRSKPISPLAVRLLEERLRQLDERICRMVNLRVRIQRQLEQLRHRMNAEQRPCTEHKEHEEAV